MKIEREPSEMTTDEIAEACRQRIRKGLTQTLGNLANQSANAALAGYQHTASSHDPDVWAVLASLAARVAAIQKDLGK